MALHQIDVAEKRAKSNAAMRDAYYDGWFKQHGAGPRSKDSYRAGFLAALKFARDSVPCVKGGAL